MKKVRALLFVKAGFADNKSLIGDVLYRLQNPEMYCKKLGIDKKPNFDITKQGFTFYDTTLAKKHYDNLKEKPFFGEVIDYMISGRIYAFVVEGDENTIEVLRSMVGATKNPVPGTIRFDMREKYGFDQNDTMRNVVHCSDSQENGEKEIAIYQESISKEEENE